MTQTDLVDWLEQHELSKPEYLARARAAARELLATRESITVNDVRAVCPVPNGMEPRVMGAIFRTADFEATGEFVQSGRKTCHNRSIRRFRLAGAECARVDKGTASHLRGRSA